MNSASGKQTTDSIYCPFGLCVLTEHNTKYNIKIKNKIIRKAQLKTDKEKNL